MKLTDYVTQFFEDQEITDMFMLTGGGCMHLVDSFGKSKKIKYWCVEHEQSAAMAAEAYSKMSNSLGLVLVTSGPGATNAITGVLDCYQDSTPVVFISGQSKSKQTVYNTNIKGLRQFGVQEANIIPIVESITKYAVEVTDPQEIKYHLQKAVYLALNGRPGPVWISIPLDVQSADIDIESLSGYNCIDDSIKIIPKKEEVDYIIQRIKKAKRPVIIGGHGVRLSGACDEFSFFVEKTHIPVVTPIMGIDIINDDHPCNIGRVGTKGTRAGNFTVQNSDLVISIGSRLSVSVVGHEYNLFAREAGVIVVDIDEIEHKKKTITNIEKIINCDAKALLQILIQLEIKCDFSKWLQICQQWKNKYPVILKTYDDDSNGINYYKFIDLINHHTSADMPIISDAGSAFYVVSQSICLKKGQRYITTGGTATMGFTLPAAIGVSVYGPTNSVIAITGDGSFMQNLQELEVVKFHNMNIKLFVMNNGGYFSINQTQKRFFNGHYVGESAQSGISFTSIEKLAYAFGINYEKIKTISEAESKLKAIVEDKNPTIVEVIVNNNMEIIPTTASVMKDNGVMISKPLEDMYPFLSRDEFNSNMIIKPICEDK